MQKRRKTKQVNQLRASSQQFNAIDGGLALLTTDETPLPPCIQKDFRQQKGRLQEEVEAACQEVIFYPRFHCELNFKCI
jgi:hypothetical protein